MNRKIAIIVTALLGSAAGMGCSPGPGSKPEETAKVLSEMEMKRYPDKLSREVEQLEYAIECSKKEIEWFANKGKIRKELDNNEAMLDFYRDNQGKCEDITYEIINTQKGPGDKGKVVEVAYWAYDVKTRGYKDFFLELDNPDGAKGRWHLVDVGGKWKIKNKKD